MSKIIQRFGKGDFPGSTGTTPYWTVNLTDIGTARFSNIFTMEAGDSVARFVRVHGHTNGLTVSSGTPVVRLYATLIANGAKPADGSGTGNQPAMRQTYATAGASVDVASTADVYFSVVIDMNSSSSLAGGQLPMPTKHMTLRVSNPAAGSYSAGTFMVDTIEILD